jgi:hypothetical protein
MSKNFLRDQMVKNTIAQHKGEPMTVEHMSQYLPDDFLLGDDDLAPFQKSAPARVEGVKAPPVTGEKQVIVPRAPNSGTQGEAVPASKIRNALAQLDPANDDHWTADGLPSTSAVQKIANDPTIRLRDIQAAAPGLERPKPQDRDIPKATAEAIEAATLRRIKADQDLANRRVELMAAQNAERDARTKLARAVTTFQNGFAPITPEQLRRSHVQEQADIRAAIKEGRLPMPRRGAGIGKSAVDRAAYWSKFGGGPGAGGGGAYRRGAMPSNVKGAPNYDPSRGAVAKLPSEL